MLKHTAQEYAKVLDVNLDERLKPVSHAVDEMLVRLEEFETMIALVQQERCNSIGITGSLTQTMDYRTEFKNLCARIDALEKVIDSAKTNIDVLENKVDAAEKQLGLHDTNKLKNFLAPIFKKNLEEASSSTAATVDEPFVTEKYFVKAEDNLQL